MTSKRATPKYILWEITLSCNLKCKHCGADAGKKHKEELTTKEALDVCKQLHELGNPPICLMGGEVFLRKDWKLITKTLVEYGMPTGLITNGFKFSQTLADEIIALGMQQVGVSLDGFNEDVHDGIRGVKGSHKHVLNAINIVNEMPLHHKTVITSVNKSNVGELEAIRDYLLENVQGFQWIINMSSPHNSDRMGVQNAPDASDYLYVAEFIQNNKQKCQPHINICAAHDLGYFVDEFDTLCGGLWEGCSAGRETFAIKSNGDIRGCLILDEKYTEGNVRTLSFDEMWHSDKFFAWNRKFTPDMLEGECKECSHGEKCRGGCSDIAELYNGTPYDYPFCLHNIKEKANA